MSHTISLIGYGEAGSTFARAGGWGEAADGAGGNARAGVWDVRPERLALAAQDGLMVARDAQEALAGRAMVLSLVTADSALPAAQDYAAFLPKGAIWADCNSVAPGTKREAAAAIEAAGGCYVDVAVLAPVDPARLNVPLLLAGREAGRAEAMLREAGFNNIRIVGDEVGRASAIKMIRSVMVKGIEALTAEMMLAAQEAGVVDEVLSSLDASEKAWPWAKRAAYNIERMVTHGARRAAEMEESAKTLTGLGIEPMMTNGTVLRQRDMAGRKERLIEGKE
ncbi:MULTISPECIES: NAD(P)-dependent oxidoreductase [unclassified Novosphingobium]|uniref:NAD(P)-dependent oxidoreductase n=1 Tax=unclassified Novosphingobium TaxID=2644732 RepID=UPI00086CFBB5|nr:MULTISPECIES: NAD(P)-dependent oxidoreductase [unclassified Novosphingobium]MBN9144832.1 NAD(P)-dependent oxidoreductase [Novosphingobium sp.]MDR6708073.1 3-hydroxyisobutyrate dehydrogenase-like beta-hydroxyacid dehydrogenase [Novosphingobium sp. 1748]ODU82161.1 MAG: 6-phosphogluconate dehydrogenase [Novosphingobium sp. SCN 63-17]OJX92244.1 MAG: 6-phosphogluconate dehydrogenase [Novosphingobium sp. 63-713]